MFDSLMTRLLIAFALFFGMKGFSSAQMPANQGEPIVDAGTPPASNIFMDVRFGPGQTAIAGSVPTSNGTAPAYKLLRYNEDYSFLKDPALRTDFFDSIKYIPLGSREDNYITIGGDMRQWFESIHNDSFRIAPNYNTYFLQRYLLHGDLHLGENLRLFGQSISGFEDGRVGGPRPDIDRNTFDVHQAFVDWKSDIAEINSITWRLGRQEFEYGSGRLIDVREGPNLRLAFDAARALTKFGDWSIDGWWGKPVKNLTGSLDDHPSSDVSFWGLYGVHPIGDGSNANVDVYYLGYQNTEAKYDQGTGSETRHTIGTRIWGRPGAFEYNLEYDYQFGTFGGGKIDAWTAANAVRYRFDELLFKPRPGIRFDVASGDRNANSKGLQTFNPLFPSGAYFNLTGPFGPSNIIDVHPTFDLTLTDKVSLTADWNFFWRQSLNDGVYRLSGSLLAAGQTSSARYIGSSPALTIIWNPTRNISILASYVHIFPGPFIRETTPGQSVDYFTTWLTYKF